ncbi:MAG TPA: MarR family transcriptional regulator [Burkholderiales bacterium]|nr:MarR family transcriptional regulator [Burkholderiales bacterium]
MLRVPSPYRPRVAAPIARVAGLDYGVLDELLGYQLRRAQVAMFLAFHAATRGEAITPPRFTALVLVGANPGIGQSTLGQVLGIARSGAMMMTDWMEERGLAERRRRPGDGRSWGVHLTARGEKLLALLKRRVAAEDRKRAAVLNSRERRELLRLLGKLAG